MDETKLNSQKQFGQHAQAYVESQIHKEGLDLKMLLEMADLKESDILLDVATGGGHTANAFAPRVKKVIALDLTQEMLEAAKKYVADQGHSNVQFTQGDAEHLPFKDETFDLVTCRIAPHHFPNIERFISEALRVLKPNGQLLLDDNVAPELDLYDQFYNQIEKLRDYSHFRAWKKTEWIQMLEKSGFVIQEWHRFEKRFVFHSWVNRMGLSQAEIQNLNQIILNSQSSIIEKFDIKIEDQQVHSFIGEAIVLKATKPFLRKPV